MDRHVFDSDDAHVSASGGNCSAGVGQGRASGASCVSGLLSERDVECVQRLAPELLDASSQVTALAVGLPGDASVDANDALALVKAVEDLQRRVEFLKLVGLRVFTRQADPKAFGVRTTAGVLAGALSISRYESRRLASLADDLTTNIGLTGAAVPARFPELACGLREGQLSIDQVQGMIREINRIPRRLKSEFENRVEHLLAEHGRDVAVEDLRIVGKRCRDWIDPDGTIEVDRKNHLDVYVTATQRGDGLWKLTGLLSAEAGITLNSLLTDRTTTNATETTSDDGTTTGEDSGRDGVAGSDGSDEHGATGTTAGESADDGAGGACGVDAAGRRVRVDVPVDTRPDGARRHDRFAQLLTRAGQSAPGGAGYALVVTATAEQVAAGRGDVEAAGGHCRLDNLLDLTPGGQFFYQSHQPGSKHLAVRTVNRFANAKQMTLLKARDRGCTFPGCDMPVGWCEAHHMIPWRHGGPTTVTNLTLLCSFHHHWHDHHGWRADMIDGLPAWIPPASIDRDQKPVFHSRFHAQRLDLARLNEPPPLFNPADTTPDTRTQRPRTGTDPGPGSETGAGADVSPETPWEDLTDIERWGVPPLGLPDGTADDAQRIDTTEWDNMTDIERWGEPPF